MLTDNCGVRTPNAAAAAGRCGRRQKTRSSIPVGCESKLILVRIEEGKPMTCWEFTLILRDVVEMTDSLANALYDAGCDDATVGSSSGVARVSFSREAATLQDAIQSAVRDVRQAGCEIARVEIERDELVAWPA